MDAFGGLLDGVRTAFAQIWESATTQTAAPPSQVVLVTGVVALAAVVVTPVWRVGRHAVTIAHEGAHAVAALIAGRRLQGIRLHSDTSGLTVSRGRSRGPGMVLTLLAGYLGPALAGLGAAWLLQAGYPMAMLWLLVLLLALLLLQLRNLFGLWSVTVSAALLVAVSWWAPAEMRSAVAYAVAWFLLAGAVRPVLELQSQRARGRARSSDADQLARLTRIPGLVWVGVFLAGTASTAVVGGAWLLGASA
ncbi:MAG: M50 family metallopeptidase [Microbacterium sp.]|uniref:M50 family metallopeptidase n=1 Tax=Microbacterium sp. TaxID=51671 RepID=UPI0039E2F80E